MPTFSPTIAFVAISGLAFRVHNDAPLGQTRRSVSSVLLRGSCQRFDGQADADVDYKRTGETTGSSERLPPEGVGLEAFEVEAPGGVDDLGHDGVDAGQRPLSEPGLHFFSV